MNLRAAAAIARRELRGGLRGFGVFLACLALGVAAIAAVGSVRMAIFEGLSREGRAILGGDAEISFTYRTATAAERRWMDERAESVSGIVKFRSMAVDPDATGDMDRALTQVKGVDAAYPLYGALELTDGMAPETALGLRDGVWGLVMHPTLIDRMGLTIGDRVRLGVADYQLRAAILTEPDQAAGGFGLGPRTILMHAALARSGLLGPGTIYKSHYRMRLPETASLDGLRADFEAAFPDSGAHWRDRRNGAPGVQIFVERIAAFLVLAGLAALAMGGVGVSSAVRSYMERKTATIATLKTLGADGATIFAVYLIQIGALTLLGVGLGLALGAAVPALLGPLLADRLPVPALFDVYAAPLVEAAIYGVLTALIFALWPLAQAREIRAAGLFRDMVEGGRVWPRPAYLIAIAALTAALIGAAVWFAGIWQLALGFVAGVAGVLIVLRLAAAGVRRLAARAARARFCRGRPALRLAFGAVGGPGGETAGVVLSLGLGLSVLAAVGQVDYNLRNVITAELPDIAPAFFFVDIQKDQLGDFLDRARAQEGVGRIDSAPMLRGVITRLNGVPVSEIAVDPGVAWVLHGDRGVTFSQDPPKGTRITRGEWWPEDYQGEPLVSFAEEQALALGLDVGSSVGVNILGREITLRIANLRIVEFRDMGINFLMTLNPGAIAGAPHTNIATVYAEPRVEGALLRDLAGAFPNITAIRVRDAIERVSSALNDLAAATRWGAAATLLTGFVVLIGAAASGERRRVYEAAVLKTLGMARPRILASFALRAAILGAAAGIVAIAAGGLAGWAVTALAMESRYAFEPVSALLIVLGGALASLVAGLGFALRPLAVRPARILRARD